MSFINLLFSSIIQTRGLTDRQTSRQAGINPGRKASRQEGRQTRRQADRKVGRQEDRKRG
jgi:hypothetical protein